MLKNFLLVLTLAAGFAACQSGDCCKKEGDTSANDAKATDGKHFGEIITADNAITFDELYSKMSGVDSLPIKVAGTVGEVCQKKGCWMTFVPADPKMEPMRVTFKDYAFFMPKDLSGKKVVVDGFAYTETTSVETLRHYAEDAKKSAEEIAKITEPKTEISYEAKGVVILD